jgi:hypothetical protein
LAASKNICLKAVISLEVAISKKLSAAPFAAFFVGGQNRHRFSTSVSYCTSDEFS